MRRWRPPQQWQLRIGGTGRQGSGANRHRRVLVPGSSFDTRVPARHLHEGGRCVSRVIGGECLSPPLSQDPVACADARVGGRGRRGGEETGSSRVREGRPTAPPCPTHRDPPLHRVPMSAHTRCPLGRCRRPPCRSDGRGGVADAGGFPGKEVDEAGHHLRHAPLAPPLRRLQVRVRVQVGLDPPHTQQSSEPSFLISSVGASIVAAGGAQCPEPVPAPGSSNPN